jgi:hypothetical protein
LETLLQQTYWIQPLESSWNLLLVFSCGNNRRISPLDSTLGSCLLDSTIWTSLPEHGATCPKVLLKLRKKQIIYIRNVILDLQPPLSTNTDRAGLIATITNHLENVQDCMNLKCMGQCNPDLHEWTEKEYTPADDDRCSGLFMDTPNLPPEDETKSFLSSGAASTKHDDPVIMVTPNLPPEDETKSFLSSGAASTKHDDPVDHHHLKLLLLKQACEALNLKREDFAAIFNETNEVHPGPLQPSRELSSATGTPPTTVDPAEAGRIVVLPAPIDPTGSLMAMVAQQQRDQKAMMIKQAEHEEILMKLLGSSQQINTISTTTATTSTIIQTTGINIGFYYKNNICKRFNSGKCNKTASHKTLHGGNILKHICAGCLKMNKGEDDTHPAKDCEFKSQFFV